MNTNVLSAKVLAHSARPLAISVVVPCFNEEECFTEVYRRLTLSCSATVGDSFEIIFVDDGSSDGTWVSISALAEQDPHVVGVKLSRNHGHQIALTAGRSDAA